MRSCDYTIHEHALPELNLGIIEVSNREYGNEYCLFIVKTESSLTGNIMEWAVEPFYLGCVLWLCDEPSLKEEKGRSITDLCGYLGI